MSPASFNTFYFLQEFLSRENRRWRPGSPTEPIDPEEEKRLLAYVLERDWLEPVKPLWHQETSKKSRAFVVAAGTGKSIRFGLIRFQDPLNS